MGATTVSSFEVDAHWLGLTESSTIKSSDASSSSAQNTSLYASRLASGSEQIRVITIERASSPSEPVRCNLETVCLLDTTSLYSAFSSSFRTAKARILLPEWIKKQAQSSANGSDQYDLPKPPDHQAERFVWGDFAALSYLWGDEARLRTIFPYHLHQ